MVHTYAGEPYHNIIINDLDTYGLELMEYRYDVPMFLYRDINSSLYNNIILEGKDVFCKVYNKENTQEEIPIILFERDKDGSVKKDDDGYPIKKPPQSIVRLNELPIEYFESLTDRLIQGNNEVYVIETAFKISDFPDYDSPDRKFYYFAKVEYG
jgi:hypothetical protein